MIDYDVVNRGMSDSATQGERDAAFFQLRAHIARLENVVTLAKLAVDEMKYTGLLGAFTDEFEAEYRKVLR